MPARPVLDPRQQSSLSILPETGSTATTGEAAGNATNYPFGMYADTTHALYDANFISGAADQVTYVYRKLGGDVLDIELKQTNVYAAYEESVLEYSYIINLHQSKNALSDFLGQTTGTFDQDGQVTSTLSSSNVNLRYPKFEFRSAKRIALGVGTEAQAGGSQTFYSASFQLLNGKQDYNLQTVVSNNAAGTEPATGVAPKYASIVNANTNKRITIRKVYYKTPQSMWRFYGYFGGLNVVGNLNNYGQFADDSSFEIIPAWQNKLQAMAFKDHLYTRLSHYSYELINNNLRIYPYPQGKLVSYIWFTFTIDNAVSAWDDESGQDTGVKGINNLNSLPFDNLPYQNINAIGKQWIRRFALALSKETLGQIRSKFSPLPIPGDNIQLNGDSLLAQAKEEQLALRDELKGILDELTYPALIEKDLEKIENAAKIFEEVPLPIYQG